jgi:hypothetical protein
MWTPATSLSGWSNDLLERVAHLEESVAMLPIPHDRLDELLAEYEFGAKHGSDDELVRWRLRAALSSMTPSIRESISSIGRRFVRGCAAPSRESSVASLSFVRRVSQQQPQWATWTGSGQLAPRSVHPQIRPRHRGSTGKPTTFSHPLSSTSEAVEGWDRE